MFEEHSSDRVLVFIGSSQLERKEILDRISEGSVLPSVLLIKLVGWIVRRTEQVGIQNGFKSEELILNIWMISNKAKPLLKKSE